MARELESFDFAQNSGKRVRPYQTKYDWDTWFATPGTIWELTQDEDFPGTSADSFRQVARNTANRRGVRIRTGQKDGKTVVIEVLG